MQLNPTKLTLKALGTDRLKLKYDEPLPNFAFKFSLRRYRVVRRPGQPPVRRPGLLVLPRPGRGSSTLNLKL